MKKIAVLIDRSLNTAVTPLAYLAVAQAMVMGLSFAVWSKATAVNETILYPQGMLFDVQVWGLVVTVGALITIFGLYTQRVSATAVGSFLLFAMWTFATIAYISTDSFFQAGLAVINLLMAGYFFLAANMGRLWNYTPVR